MPELFFHTLWQTVLNLGSAWPAEICAAKTQTSSTIQISPPKGTKDYFKDFEKILQLKVGLSLRAKSFTSLKEDLLKNVNGTPLFMFGKFIT